MTKKNIINIIRIILIFLPIIVFLVYLCKTFNGVEYKLDVNSDNILDVEESLQKDNINIENLNDVTKIELCGQGLLDYDSLNFYYSGGKIKSVNLYITKQNYYIYEYLRSNTFGYNNIFNISVLVSLLTICVTIYTSRKKKINQNL